MSERIHGNVLKKKMAYLLATLRIQCAYRAYRTRCYIGSLVDLGCDELYSKTWQRRTSILTQPMPLTCPDIPDIVEA